MKKEIKHNKNENRDNYYDLARATEKKLQQMSDKVETTDKEQEKHIKKDMEEMKKRYVTVNEKFWNLETRMDTMRVVDVEADQGGGGGGGRRGGVHGRPHLLRYVIDFRSPMLCIKIGYGVYYVLG